MRNIRDCSVCVVGGAGFLGSHLVDHLVNERKCRVLVIDNLVSGRLEFINPEARFEHADITVSESHLYHLFVQNKIQYVMNYAASPYVPLSYERPLHVFNINAMGALNVINASQEAGVEGILQVSSAEIYGDAAKYEDVNPPQLKEGDEPRYTPSPDTFAVDEESEVRPHSSYGTSKAAIDAMVQVRWRESRTPCIALRQFNCVGPRETHPYVVPEIISQLHAPYFTSIPQTLRLGNNSFRDFLYAGDAVRMAVELLEKGSFGDVVNMGSESGVKIYELAQMLSDIIGCGRVKIVEDPSRVRRWEIWHLQSDNSKLYSIIESRPTVPLKEALKRTVDYYLANGRKWVWE